MRCRRRVAYREVSGRWRSRRTPCRTARGILFRSRRGGRGGNVCICFLVPLGSLLLRMGCCGLAPYGGDVVGLGVQAEGGFQGFVVEGLVTIVVPLACRYKTGEVKEFLVHEMGGHHA